MSAVVILVAIAVLALIIFALFLVATGGDESTDPDPDPPITLAPLSDEDHLRNLVHALAPFATVEVGADNRTAVLRGFVGTQGEANAAARTARDVAGTTGVENQLVVLMPQLLGALTQEGVNNPEAMLNGNVVTVRGTVSDLDARDAAVFAVDQVPSIDHVIDELTVGAPIIDEFITRDTDLTHAVSRAVALAVSDVGGLVIRIDGDTAVLSGFVPSESDVQSAATAAFAVPGIDRVRNDLEARQPDRAIESQLRLEPIQFDTGESTIRSSSFATLDSIVAILKTTDAAFEIQGFADVRGTEQDNLILSQERANTVLQYVWSQGVTNRLSARGYGETRSFGADSSLGDLAANRRVRFVLASG